MVEKGGRLRVEHVALIGFLLFTFAVFLGLSVEVFQHSGFVPGFHLLVAVAFVMFAWLIRFIVREAPRD